MNEISPNYEFDVALSFAGEDRKYVGNVASELKRLNVSFFYDEFETVNLWGKDLYAHLQDVYQKQARYAILFLSEHYAKKAWTNHERKAAQARAFNENKEYILPARFDQTEIEGILPTVGYIDLNKYTPEKFAKLIQEKVLPAEKHEKSLVLEKPTETTQNKYISFLITNSDGNSILMEASQVLIKENNLSVSFFDSNDSLINVFLSNLSKQTNQKIAVAFRNSAFNAKLLSASQEVKNFQEAWQLEMNLAENSFNSFGSEMAYGSLSAEQIAELRARRILLAEKVSESPVIQNCNFQSDDVMLEVLVRGLNTQLHIEQSAFPKLYFGLKNQPEAFLEMSRLVAVMQLIFSGTVEHILQLDLQMISEDKLKVLFEGIRARRYVNVEPYKINFEGLCNLSEENIKE